MLLPPVVPLTVVPMSYSESCVIHIMRTSMNAFIANIHNDNGLPSDCDLRHRVGMRFLIEIVFVFIEYVCIMRRRIAQA